jgi:hypothetical protein
VLDKSGSLGPFLDATIPRTKQTRNTKTPNENTVAPVSSPESRECPSDDFEETYIEHNDEFIEEFHATRYASAIKSLLARCDVR